MTSITPKPMSTERRAEIEQVILQWATTGKSKLLYAAEDLLADAAYWREAVRGEDFEWRNDDGDIACYRCRQLYSYGSSRIDHKPDCPWLRAQSR